MQRTQAAEAQEREVVQLRETELQRDDETDQQADHAECDTGPDEAAHDAVVVDDLALLGDGCFMHDEDPRLRRFLE